MYERILQKAGLPDKQAKVYIACLEMGRAKAPDIAKKAGIKRSTAYAILDELIQTGLVNYSQRGGIKLFKAQDPQTILEILNERQQAIKNILPDLENIFTSHHLKPRIQFFEGKEGIKRVFEDTLKCKYKQVFQIVRVKDFIEYPGEDYSKEYIKKRAEKGVQAYALHPVRGDIQNEIYGKTSTKLKRIVRYALPEIFHTLMIMIYDYKVAMISTRAEGFGFIIESKEFSQTMKSHFDFIWDRSSDKPEI